MLTGIPALIAIIHAVQPEKRAGYSGMVVGMYGIASVAGPLIGGAFTSNVTWRWCFYINLPAGGVSIAGVLFLFPHTKAATNLLTADEPTNLRGRIAKFDPVGSVFLLASVTCLLLALQLGGTSYAFSNGRIIALFVIFGILFIGFIVLQFLGGKNATVPPGVLKQRSVLSSTFYMFCVGGHFFILVYFLPIWFQGVRGLSALDSGIRTLPILLAQTFCVVLGGVIVSVTGYYVPLMWASVVLASLGTGLLTTLQVDSGAGMWIGYQILYGIGGGIGYQQGITAAQTVLGPSEAAIGTALMVFVQNLGGTVFVSAASNLFNTKLVQNVEEVVPRLTREQILASGATAFREELTNDEYPLVLGAYNSAIVLTFRMALIMACLCSIGAAGVEWKRASTKESREAIEEHSKGGQTDESRNKTTRIITLPDSRLSGS